MKFEIGDEVVIRNHVNNSLNGSKGKVLSVNGGTYLVQTSVNCVYIHGNYLLSSKPVDYLPWALSKERSYNNNTVNGAEARKVHLAMGMVGEAAEASELVKKHVFYKKPLDEKALLNEIADTYFYMTLLLDTIGMSIEDAMSANRDKLDKRYSSGFSEQAAVDRVDVTQAPEIGRAVNLHYNKKRYYIRDIQYVNNTSREAARYKLGDLDGNIDGWFKESEFSLV